MKEKAINKRFYLLALLPGLLFAGAANAQFPILDKIAEKVVQKYQESSCEQLWQKKGEPKPAMEQEVLQKLRGNPEMRTAFINRVAAPIANKMFECGMIPRTSL